MALTFAKIILTLRLQKNVRSPYIFFNLKNRFDSAFRRSIDCGRSSCSGCRNGEDCLYDRILSQSLAVDPAALKRYQKPSFPFVFHFPIIHPSSNRGTSFELEMVLIGPAAEHYRHFIEAFSAACVDFAVPVKAESVDYQGNRYLLMEHRGEMHQDHLFLFSAEEISRSRQVSECVLVRFITPLLLLRQGHPLHELSFSTFIRALFRRVSSLVYYYGGDEMDCDFKLLAERSCLVATLESNLAWAEWEDGPAAWRLGGIIGRVVFSGGLDSFYPFLLLGQYFNLGKSASFGHGQYLLD
ncbi:CRISPR system precrRNA processing endoribonuclease RAMP protein Cas6 [Geotalea sp. SG265]|uniref:CRISPR system precrRNA processing endoribonuclease RAMP protein Cas6 n=1 Tax=Geotalea sp. SG265 TaxID=2922867 RepID=UPI001FAEC359|nr:CRISPR system precrRNA processing endoribonuclease RAMP protein Cas6 [Geotalea sp. SG265]